MAAVDVNLSLDQLISTVIHITKVHIIVNSGLLRKALSTEALTLPRERIVYSIICVCMYHR